MRYDTIPEEMKRTNRWVCAWNGSKCPMQAYIRKAASSTSPDTWSHYDAAKRAVESGAYDYLGYVLGDGLIGIDIDKGYDDDGFLSDLSVDCMRACRSYTEQSRSGRGIHIYVRGKLPFSGANNHQGLEIYASGRYFIVTGERLIYGEIIENQEAIDYIVDKYFPNEARAASSGERKERIYTPTYTCVSGKMTITYPKILPGMRNISLTSLAGQLHAQGATPKEIFRKLLKVKAECCSPQLPRDEVTNIVRSVTKYKR